MSVARKSIATNETSREEGRRRGREAPAFSFLMRP
jgi:hypothetical protein